MGVHVIIGNPEPVAARVRDLLDAARAHDARVPVDDFDLDDPAQHGTFLAALDTPPLFGGPRVLLASPVASLTHPGKLHHVGVDDTVIVHGPSNTKPPIVTGPGVHVEKTTVADAARTTRNLLDRWWRTAPHTVSSAARAQVDALAETDPGTLRAVLATLGLLAETGHPVDDDAVAALTPSSTGAGNTPPWTVWGHLLAGRLDAALDAAGDTAPLALWSYVASTLAHAGRAAEAPDASAQTLARLYGLSAHQARDAARVAEVLRGPDQWAQVWRLAADVDVALKTSPHPRSDLTGALVQLHLLLHPAPC